MFKALNVWLPTYLRRRRRMWNARAETHLVFCVCDHFEPFHDASREEALARVRKWGKEYPGVADACRDSGGEPLRHTFFYPIEQYDEEVLARMSDLCRGTRCETEIHLHHDGDNAAGLAAALALGKERLASHGLLAEDEVGEIRFGFIHGDWALDNSAPDGRHCGVVNELRVLQEAGCYADFTLPSAPNRAQTRTINSIYYATPGDQPKSHDRGRAARAGVNLKGEGFLLVQGPLGLNWRWRKWGVLPRIENADLTGANPPTLSRLQCWLELGVGVEGRPEWIFAKLHTHGGGVRRNMEMLLGQAARDFHTKVLPEFAARNPGFQWHYATAREVVNMVHAAEAGMAGDPSQYRDYRYKARIRSETP